MLWSTSAFCSTQKDSLYAVWKDSSNHDTTRLKVLSTLSVDIYQKTNLDSSLHYAELQCTLARKTNHLKFEAAGLLAKGHALRLLGNPILALSILEQSLTIYTQIDDRRGISDVLHLIGSIYFDQEAYKKSLKYLIQALEIRQKIGDKYEIARSYNTLGYWYDENRLYQKALEYHNECLRIRKEIKDLQGISWCYNNIARVYFHQHNLYEAEYWYAKSIALKEELGEYTVGETKGNLGLVYLRSGRVKEAIKICKEGFDQSRSVGFDIGTRTNCECLYKSYKKNENWEKAFVFYEIYIEQRDSLLSSKNKQALIQSELQYKYDMKEALAQIEARKKVELAEEKTKKQQIVIYAIAIGAILLIIFLVQIFKSLKKSRAQQKVINSQKTQVSQKNREIMDSINYAKRIQQAILTPASEIKNYLPDSFIIYKPKDVVAGDFYWMEKTADMIIFAVADCTGHGVPGAMVSVVCNNALNRAVREFGLIEPGEILDKTRDLVIQQFENSTDKVKDGMDISLCVYTPKTNVLKWAGANNPLWIVRNDEVIITKGDKQPIAHHPITTPFKTHQLTVLPKDKIYLFTDGYTDQFGGEHDKKFKAGAFKKLLLKIADVPMQEQMTILNQTFENWRGKLEQIDDVCVMGFQVH